MAAFAYAEQLDSMDGLGIIIRRWITRTGKNQSRLAEMVGVTSKTVSRWVNEERAPAPENRPQLRDILGLEEDEFEEALRVTQERIAAKTVALHRDGHGGALPGIEQDGYVSEFAPGLVEWHSAVGLSQTTPPAVKMLLTAIAFRDFITDISRGLVVVTTRELVDRFPNITRELLEEHWDEVLESPFVERQGEAEWVFRLRFP